MKIVSLLLVSFIFMLTGCFKTYDSANGSDTNNPTDSQYLQVSNFTDDISESNNGDVGTSTTSPSSPTSTSTSTLISIEKYIAISFSEVIDANTVNVSSAYIKDKNQLAIAAELTVVGNQINIIPNEFFLPNERYTIVITTAVKDIHGRTLKNEFNYTFVTTPVETTLPNDAVPSLVTLSPANGTKASVTTDIVMIFSEDIAGNGSLIVKDSNTNGIVSGTNTINGSSLRFVPQNLLAYDANYSVTLQGTVEDLEGNAYVGLTNWSFSVTPENDTAAPVLQQLTPAANTQASASTYVRMVFDEVIAGNGNIKLKNSDTNVVINGTTSKFDNILHFIPQSELSPGTNYTVTLQGNVKDLADNEYTGQTSWSFTVAPPVDNTPPTLTLLTPTDGATDVDKAINIMMVFDENIADNGITLDVRDSLNNQVAGANSVSANTFNFDPTNDLTDGETYTATVVGTIKDLSNNSYTGQTSWSFTVAPPVDNTPPTLTLLTPTDGATDVDKAINIMMVFDENIADNGITLDVRDSLNNQVAGANSVSANTFNFDPTNDLTDGETYTATVVGTIKDLSNNSYTGQTSWSFTVAPPVDNTPPTLTLLTPTDGATDVDKAINIMMVFDENIADNGITLDVRDSLNNQVAGANSVSANTFNFDPTNDLTDGETYTATVVGTIKDLSNNSYTGQTSWSFTVAPPVDNTPPTLTLLTPTDGATDVDKAINIMMVFDENIADNGITLDVRDSLNNQVAGANSVSANTFNFDPTNDLTDGETYTATVVGTIKDLSNNSYTGQTSWSFTVAPLVDTTPPLMTSLTPDDNEIDVDSNTTINIIFNENINNTGETLKLTDVTLNNQVSGASGVTANKLWFIPDNILIEEHQYIVEMLGPVFDLAGNEYTGQTNWSFTVVPFEVSNVFISGELVVVSFSDHLNPATVSEINFEINFGAITFQEFFYSDLVKTVSFKPDSTLSGAEIISVSGTIEDTLGNSVNDGIPMDYTL